MLTQKEFDLINSTEFPLLKQSAILKIKSLFQSTADYFISQNQGKTHFTNAKITTGENYEGLPYVVADIPKLTSEKPHLHIRMVFWWGNYFAIQYFVNTTLSDCRKLIANLHRMPDWYVMTENNIWSNNIQHKGWVSCVNLKVDDYITIQHLETIKICGLVAIADYKRLPDALMNFYRTIQNIS